LKKPKVTSFGCIAPQLEDSKRYKPNGLYLNTGRNSIIVSCMRGFVEMGI
jgi:hypothetical protein